MKLESLVVRVKKQFEKELFDRNDVGQEILQGLKTVKEDKVQRHHWEKTLEEEFVAYTLFFPILWMWCNRNLSKSIKAATGR